MTRHDLIDALPEEIENLVAKIQHQHELAITLKNEMANRQTERDSGLNSLVFVHRGQCHCCRSPQDNRGTTCAGHPEDSHSRCVNKSSVGIVSRLSETVDNIDQAWLTLKRRMSRLERVEKRLTRIVPFRQPPTPP